MAQYINALELEIIVFECFPPNLTFLRDLRNLEFIYQKKNQSSPQHLPTHLFIHL